MTNNILFRIINNKNDEVTKTFIISLKNTNESVLEILKNAFTAATYNLYKCNIFNYEANSEIIFYSVIGALLAENFSHETGYFSPKLNSELYVVDIWRTQTTVEYSITTYQCKNIRWQPICYISAKSEDFYKGLEEAGCNYINTIKSEFKGKEIEQNIQNSKEIYNKTH